MAACLHAPRAGHGINRCAHADFKGRTSDGQARRLHDVNKHWSILPSKGPSHCCGQRCLARVMSDDVAGSVLVVLMYSGAFHDLLKACGEGGVCSTTVLNLHRSKSSVKTDNRVRWYQRSFLLKTMEERPRDFKDLCSQTRSTNIFCLFTEDTEGLTGFNSSKNTSEKKQNNIYRIHLDLGSKRESNRQTASIPLHSGSNNKLYVSRLRSPGCHSKGLYCKQFFFCPLPLFFARHWRPSY